LLIILEWEADSYFILFNIDTFIIKFMVVKKFNKISIDLITNNLFVITALVELYSLNQLLRFEELSEVQNLPGGQSKQAAHRKQGEI